MAKLEEDAKIALGAAFKLGYWQGVRDRKNNEVKVGEDLRVFAKAYIEEKWAQS